MSIAERAHAFVDESRLYYVGKHPSYSNQLSFNRLRADKGGDKQGREEGNVKRLRIFRTKKETYFLADCLRKAKKKEKKKSN